MLGLGRSIDRPVGLNDVLRCHYKIIATISAFDFTTRSKSIAEPTLQSKGLSGPLQWPVAQIPDFGRRVGNGEPSNACSGSVWVLAKVYRNVLAISTYSISPLASFIAYATVRRQFDLSKVQLTPPGCQHARIS
jgi:hypothetical protein